MTTRPTGGSAEPSRTSGLAARLVLSRRFRGPVPPGRANRGEGSGAPSQAWRHPAVLPARPLPARSHARSGPPEARPAAGHRRGWLDKPGGPAKAAKLSHRVPASLKIHTSPPKTLRDGGGIFPRRVAWATIKLFDPRKSPLRQIRARGAGRPARDHFESV